MSLGLLGSDLFESIFAVIASLIQLLVGALQLRHLIIQIDVATVGGVKLTSKRFKQVITNITYRGWGSVLRTFSIKALGNLLSELTTSVEAFDILR